MRDILKNLANACRFALAVSLVQCALSTPAFALTVNKMAIWNAGPDTKIVMNMNGNPKDLAVSDNPGKPMSISFKGSLPGKPVNKDYSFPNLNGVFVDNRHGKVQLFIKRNVIGTVSVNHSGNLLTVSIPHNIVRHVAVAKASAKPAMTADQAQGIAAGAAAPVVQAAAASVNGNEISPGVKQYKFAQSTPGGPVRINVLEVDPKNPAVEIQPTLASGRMGSKASVANMVASNQAVAGINGSFFKQDVGIPLGTLIINQELVSGPIYDRVALGITPNNDLVMERIRLAGEIVLPDGRKIRLSNINQPRIGANQTVIYSSRWGKTAPKVPSNGLQIQLRNGKVAAVSNGSPLAIPRDGVVISGPATPEMSALAFMPPSQPVQLNVYTLPDWSSMKHAIGGGPWLVKDGRAYVDLHAQHFSSKQLGYREPRSAVGITRDGKLLLVAVDGRRKGVSVGMTLYELAYFLQKMGAVEAMNLDGGSSTQMAVYGKTVNMPSSGSVGVSNSLIIRRTNGDNVAVDRD